MNYLVIANEVFAFEESAQSMLLNNQLSFIIDCFETNVSRKDE